MNPVMGDWNQSYWCPFICCTIKLCSAIKLSSYVALLLLSRFSRVQLCVTPQMAAYQAPLSLGFSRQEHWSGVPLPSPVQSCPTLSNPVDCSPPGSSVHGIFPDRVLEWGAIAFSDTHSTHSQIYIPHRYTHTHVHPPIPLTHKGIPHPQSHHTHTSAPLRHMYSVAVFCYRL